MLCVTVQRESNHHDRPEEEEAITDLHLQLQQENAALRPSYRTYAEQLAKESSAAPTMEAEAQSSHINGTQHEFFQICQQPYNHLETTIESSGSQAVGTLLPASAYINFIEGTYSRLATTQHPNSTANAYTENHIVGNEQRFYPPSASTSEPNDKTTSFPSVAGHLVKQITEGMNHRDMNSLRRNNSVFKCPDRSSNTTAHSEEDLNVPGNGSAGSGTGSSSDELEEPPHDQAGYIMHGKMMSLSDDGQRIFLPAILAMNMQKNILHVSVTATLFLRSTWIFIRQGAHKIEKNR
jgi:hypothetical protein